MAVVSTVTSLRIGIGFSEATDGRVAGVAAAESAVADLGGEPTALVIVYASVSYDLPALLAAVASVTGDARVVGASSNGQFHRGSMIAPGIGVSVLAMSSGEYGFGTAVVTGIGAEAFECGKRLARLAREAADGSRAQNSALLVLADGLSGCDLAALLSGIYRVTGASVPVVGGAAADDGAIVRSYVFHGDTALSDAAVAVWISSPRPLTVTSAHGWRPEGLPMLVTRVEGSIVHEIGGRPAVEVFREYFRDRTDRSGATLARDGFDARRAFGVVEPDGTQTIRAAGINANGQLYTFAPLQEYSAVRIVTCNADTLLGVSEEIIGTAIAGHDPAIVLAFSCTGRMEILAERRAEEPLRLQRTAGSIPTFGFYTYGEFARTSSVAGYHNATITAIAL